MSALVLVKNSAQRTIEEESLDFLEKFRKARQGVSAEDVAAAIEEWQAAIARKRQHRGPSLRRGRPRAF